MSSKISLSQVVAELIDSMDRSEHYFRRLYRIGVRGARKFNMDIYGQFRSVLLDVPTSGVVPFPKDYLQYSMLGVINNQGEAVPIKHNEQLSKLKQQYLASQEQIIPVPKVPTGIVGGFENPQGFPFYWMNYVWGDCGYVHLYGLGGGSQEFGWFTIDEINQCFLIAPNYPYTTIMLEYLSDGFDINCNDYMVDIRAVDAMQWWIRWMDRGDTPKRWGRGDVQYAQQQYVLQSRMAKARINHANINEMQTEFRKNIKLTAKA